MMLFLAVISGEGDFDLTVPLTPKTMRYFFCELVSFSSFMVPERRYIGWPCSFPPASFYYCLAATTWEKSDGKLSLVFS